MIMYHFSIYDEVTLIYNLPFIAHNVNDAKRMFLTNMKNPNSNLHANPGDFSLYHVASYDNETGEYTNIFPKELILKGSKSMIEDNNHV